MLDAAVALKEDFESLLNPSAFTLDSVEGWIIILLCLFLIYEISQKAVRFAGWLVGAIMMFQICHWLSYTGLNNIIPFGSFFKYDILTAVAQCFVGTKICDFLLYVNSFIHLICDGMWDVMSRAHFVSKYGQ